MPGLALTRAGHTSAPDRLESLGSYPATLDRDRSRPSTRARPLAAARVPRRVGAPAAPGDRQARLGSVDPPGIGTELSGAGRMALKPLTCPQTAKSLKSSYPGPISPR